VTGIKEMPHDLQGMVADQAMKNAHNIERLPRELDALIRVLLQGDFGARVRLLSDEEDVRIATGMMNRFVMAVVASALSLVSALMVSAGSAPTLNGVRIANLLGAVGLFFGLLLILRLVVQIVREGD
jgi:hypothetical protein